MPSLVSVDGKAREGAVNTNDLMGQMGQAKTQQLEIARSWLRLFTVVAMFVLWFVLFAELQFNFYVAFVLGFVVAFVLSRILAVYVGMVLGRRYARKLNKVRF